MSIKHIYAPRTGADSGYALLLILARWCNIHGVTLWLDDELYPAPLLAISVLVGAGHRPRFGILTQQSEDHALHCRVVEEMTASELSFAPRTAFLSVPARINPMTVTADYWEECSRNEETGIVLDLRHLDFTFETDGFISVLTHLGATS